MQIIPGISNRLPASLHNSGRRVKIVPAAINILPTLGITAIRFLELPCPVRLVFPAAFVQAICLGNTLGIRHSELPKKTVIPKPGVVLRIGDERMFDNDAGNAHLASVCDYAVVVSQAPIGIFAVVLGIPNLNTAILKTKGCELIEDILAQLLSGFMSALVVTAAIGIINLGSVSTGALGRIYVKTHEHLCALIHRTLGTLIQGGALVLRPREDDRHACVTLKFRFASQGYFPIDIRFLEARANSS